ncbi:anti-sigma factor domain-containing protein [Acidovorax sp. A1169]|jgi:anti-sigma-K factor RskA|uniref:anti-sigma factor n=1 Tax=Acidovorax sp. A1169 TaxID=3059524 RepID=UPI0027379AD9|nr:anti-sigma factor [Acidovorax sp. A1169]MDP4073347.1 anti-sigma factor [Acidovorax sp. A1169]
MNITQHPELLDRLAASYALGTLRGGARRRFETLAREHAAVRAAALVWQTHWSGLAELQELAQPDAAVWKRIDNLVQADRQAQAMQAARLAGQEPALPGAAAPGGWLRSLLLWRGAAAAGALATLAAVVVGVQVNGGLRASSGTQIAELRQQLQAAPQIQYVAVLADDKAAASMLVTFDPKNNQLVLQRVGGFQEGSDKSLQLWALPPAGGPRSLGVLGQEKLLNLTAGEADVRQVPALAISLEPRGGVPSAGGPTGPVLFKGELIQRML